MLARNIRSLLNRYFNKADIKGIKVNDLRNTFIVFQLKRGVPLTLCLKWSVTKEFPPLKNI